MHKKTDTGIRKDNKVNNQSGRVKKKGKRTEKTKRKPRGKTTHSDDTRIGSILRVKKIVERMAQGKEKDNR